MATARSGDHSPLAMLAAAMEASRARASGAGGAPDEPLFGVECRDGRAGPFPCRGVSLESFLPLSAIGGGQGNDIWGWTDRETGREYALFGKTTGTAFVDISTPDRPVYLGDLPSHQRDEDYSIWRGIKVYADHAYVVSEKPGHGMQVFDLTRLRGVGERRTWTEDAQYARFGSAHTIAIDEDSGFAYACGSNTCRGGPHIVDVRSPKSPVFAGCFDEDGYTHETQAAVYRGPDSRFAGREICFNCNEDTLTIVDVTDKRAPRMLSRTGYEGSAFTHQGWLTPDHRHFLLNDELDEQRNGVPTTTYIFGVEDLTSPALIGAHRHSTRAIDHNLYVKGDRVYEANYRAGLRILDCARVAEGELREVAFFDVYPDDDAAEFNGAWSVYPYFDSGIVVVSGIEQGLFVLRPE